MLCFGVRDGAAGADKAEVVELPIGGMCPTENSKKLAFAPSPASAVPPTARRLHSSTMALWIYSHRGPAESLLPLPLATFHPRGPADADCHGDAAIKDVEARTGGTLKLSRHATGQSIGW